MTTIHTRAGQIDPAAVATAKKLIAQEVAVEFDKLVNRMDSFLEMRIAAEFDELREDIEQVTIENAMLRDQVTALTIENINLHMKLANTP